MYNQSLCCTLETNSIVNQLNSDIKLKIFFNLCQCAKKNRSPHKWLIHELFDLATQVQYPTPESISSKRATILG